MDRPYGNRTAALLAIVVPHKTDSMQVYKTGKAASIRLSNDKWILDFAKDFDASTSVIDEVLGAVSQLCQLAAHINYSDLY